MKKMNELFLKERAVGTEANHKVLQFLERRLSQLGYGIKKLPFDCWTWRRGKAELTLGNRRFVLEASPFSSAFNGKGKIMIAKTVEELEKFNCQNSILVLADALTREPLSPKNYPFYYPDGHKSIIQLLEEKAPLAIIAATGKTLLNGTNPFPLFEDGNFMIPSANFNQQFLPDLEEAIRLNSQGRVIIDSRKTPAWSYQLVAEKKTKKSKGKIIIAAHMDTKYGTPGALDNGAGLAVLMRIAEIIESTQFDIEIIPFNSEEYFEASGELLYLADMESRNEQIILMVNIDSPCHIGSKPAISSYGLPRKIEKTLQKIFQNNNQLISGEQWFAGDHVPFVFRKIPCLAVTSSDFFTGALVDTHTSRDTIETVNQALIEPTAQNLTAVIKKLTQNNLNKQ